MTNLEVNTIQFYNAKDVSIMLGISETSAYRIIKQLNDELKLQGYIIIPGKIGRTYFKTKIRM